MRLRPVTLEDVAWLPRLADHLFAPWEEGYGEAVARWMSHDTTLGWVATVPSASTGPGGVAGDRPVGFILLGSVGLVGPSRPHVLDVLALGVHPDHRRAGIGRALLAQALRHARAEAGALEIRLTVADDNAAGLALFQQAGFQVQREDDGTFGKGRRAIRMRWRPR